MLDVALQKRGNKAIRCGSGYNSNNCEVQFITRNKGKTQRTYQKTMLSEPINTFSHEFMVSGFH